MQWEGSCATPALWNRPRHSKPGVLGTGQSSAHTAATALYHRNQESALYPVRPFQKRGTAHTHCGQVRRLRGGGGSGCSEEPTRQAPGTVSVHFHSPSMYSGSVLKKPPGSVLSVLCVPNLCCHDHTALCLDMLSSQGACLWPTPTCQPSRLERGAAPMLRLLSTMSVAWHLPHKTRTHPRTPKPWLV